MRIRIQKWGNSLALRIPKVFAAEARLEQDKFVEVSLVRPHGIGADLEAGYRQMAEDETREAEAFEWVEATFDQNPVGVNPIKPTPAAPGPAGTASSSPG